uniref:Uncharacterized protein n=1 Tax=Buteo japonicus TaxID=224669 RepID=A0A8C0BIU1_9AVES
QIQDTITPSVRPHRLLLAKLCRKYLLSFTRFSVLCTPSSLEKRGSSSPRGLHLCFSAQKASTFFINLRQVKENTSVTRGQPGQSGKFIYCK